MNERPARWLAHPTERDEQDLIAQFGAYGIPPSLLSKNTLDLLDRKFERFAPLMVAAQRPPHAPDQDLQAWYRARADEAQGAAMRRGLREWLTAPVTTAPWEGGMRAMGSDEATARAVLRARLGAAEALGDWRDVESLADLHALAARLPAPEPALVVAIRRIESPDWPDILAFDAAGRVRLGRTSAEIESLIVERRDDISRENLRSVVDRIGMERLWHALGVGHAYDRRHPEPPTDWGSSIPRRLFVQFRDGERAELYGSGSIWEWREAAHPRRRLELVVPSFSATILAELRRMKAMPSDPRFVSEWVTLRIRPGELEVTGRYEFEGAPSGGSLALLYPIATGKGLGIPTIETVALRSRADRSTLPVTHRWSRGECHMVLQPGSTSGYVLEVRYRQPLTGRSATYLTTTAKEWGRPLHRASFQIVLDPAMGEPRFELPFRELDRSAGQRLYVFEASPYRPDKDIVITW